MALKLKPVNTHVQLDTTSTAAGFYMKMTLLIPPTPPSHPRQELYFRSKEMINSPILETFSDYVRQLP